MQNAASGQPFAVAGLRNRRAILREVMTKATCLLLIGAIFIGDLLLCESLSMPVFYIPVILLSARVYGSTGIVLMSWLCFSLTLIGLVVSNLKAPHAVSALRALADFICLVTASLFAFDAKTKNDELRRSEAYLAGAQRISHTSSIGFTPSGTTIYLSDEARRIFELDAGEPPSFERIIQRAHPDDLSAVRSFFRDAVAQQDNLTIEHRLRMPDGRIKYVHLLAHAIRDQHGNCEYVGALMDVSAKKCAEEALLRSQAELAHITRMVTLNELAASIAHEVNQPLSAIRTSAEASLRWLDRDEPDHLEVRNGIQRTLSATCRASEVIQRIRALSKKATLEHTPLDLWEVVEESLALIQREVTRNRITLSAAVNDAPLALNGDRVQLQQVVINLVMNAMQAITQTRARQGHILLTLTRVELHRLKLTITDSGPGIAPDVLPNLFEPFFTTKSEGIGMGLSICRSIVEHHGGEIWATSETGLGATFHLVLPEYQAG
ncbi:sensor histidine kinase [Pseudomonas sp. NPDC090202]|uniref:sensor histidine kinase n=1 Tax=unclassified Pseudomonas TaxID=196821 RepID=UPI00381CA733